MTESDMNESTPVEMPDVQVVAERKIPLLDYLKTVIKANGSDLHLQAGSVPMVRIDGRARFLEVPPLTDESMEEYVETIIQAQGEPEQRQQVLDRRGSVDVAYTLPGMARFRTSIFHSRERFAITMRRIVTTIPSFEELNLPPMVETLADFHRGIVIVAGTTGSGKSTTLAALIGKINRMRAERIITVEDPVEFQFENQKSLVSQVEIGTDSESYEYALRAMMRQDPDVIMIGEIRDTFSLSTALRAADTGHLVFTTVHATNAPTCVERLVSLVDPAQKELQRAQLGLNLVAVVCQRLAKKREGKGRIPVIEIMMRTPLVQKYIMDNDLDKLKGCVGNREGGCLSFDQHLAELFQKQIIDVSEARRLASNQDALNLALRGISNSDTRLK